MSQKSGSRHYANIRNSIYYKLFLCCLLTLVAMYAHRFFPVKTLTMVPAVDTVAYLYMDESPNGKSYAEWVDQEALQWRCLIDADGRSYTCGFHFIIGGGEGHTGMDLSGYESVRIEVSYRGSDNRLRFYMRNYEPGFSDVARIETTKFNYISIADQFVNDPLVIHIKEFSVADWWLHAMQVPRELARPNFEHVVAFGIDLNYPAPVGQHDFKLNKVEFVGLWVSAEHWYFSILLFWIVVIIIAGALHLARLSRSFRVEHVRLEKLARQNSLLEEESNKYKQLSLRDHLTQLLNRQGLSELIEERFPAGAQQKASLLVIDLDHFKMINDTLGHESGDVVLREVAGIIAGNIRQTDSAARWGGEEFVVVSPNTSSEDARHFAEKLRSLVATHRFEAFPDLQVTISIGVGEHSGEQPFHMLFRRVDVALYQAKAMGRNRTVVAADE